MAQPCDGPIEIRRSLFRETFEKCKLDLSEREKHAETYALHRDLLKLRKSEAVFSRQDRQFDGAILGPEAFVVRFFSEGYRDDRLLVVNLGEDLHLNPAPEPLLGPPENTQWEVQWSTEDPRYGGNGTPPLDSERNWIIPAHAAVVLRPAKMKEGIANLERRSASRCLSQVGERRSSESLVDKEWLVTNGLGGYASGSLAGVITRGFHGYLVAALPTPLGRMMMLNDLIEKVELPDGQTVQLSGEERVNAPLKAQGAEYLEEFCLEDGVPVWIFKFGDVLLEKRVLMVHRQNTVHVNYRLKSGSVKMTLRPSVNFRPHEAPVSTPLAGNYAFTVIEDTFEIAAQKNIPALRLMLHGKDKSLTMDRTRFQEIVYRIEESRGYAAHGDLWSPGYFSVVLTPQDPVTLVASVESWDAIRAVSPKYAESAESLRHKRLLSRASEVPAEGMAARAGAGCRSVHYYSGRTRRGYAASASRGRRCEDDYRGLSVVHGLGPRHDDLA